MKPPDNQHEPSSDDYYQVVLFDETIIQALKKLYITNYQNLKK